METDETNIQKSKENEEEEKGLSKKLLNEWKEWLGDFTMHGFGNIINAEYVFTRIIWTLLTTGAIVYSIYCKWT